jgi:hypothetical protein
MKVWRLLCNFSRAGTLVGALAGLSACSEDAPKDAESPAPNGTGTDLIGSFQLKLAATGTTSILGKVSSGPTPAALAWEEIATSGDCTLAKPVVPFCDPGCGSDVCVSDGVCQAHPEARNAGDVRVSGLQTVDGPIEFSLIKVSSAYQAPPTVALSFPPFAEGETVRFSADGGDLPAFTLEANGIAPLIVTSSALAIAAGQALSLSWQPAADPASSTLHVELDISHHGGTKGMISCEATDDGSLSIDSALVDQLVDLGVAGFPTVILSRRAVGSTLITPGRIDLVIASDVELAIEVPGVVSCNMDEECPSGTCQTDLTCG